MKLQAQILAMGASMTLAGAALAAEDDHGAAAHAEGGMNVMPQIAPFIAALILFTGVVLVLNKFAWPAILKALQERENKIKGDIESAERTRKQAERALQEYEKALSEARGEASKMLEETKAEQQRIAADLRARTEAELNAMRDAAKRDIEAAKKAAIAEVYGHMADTATGIASKILQRELNPDDQRQLVEESLGQLATVRSN